MTINLNLIVDSTQYPNGLHPKYHKWWRNNPDINQYNVFTRFIPDRQNRYGWFPLLLRTSKISFRTKTIEQLDENENNIYVIELNHDDQSMVFENCFGCINEKSVEMLREGKMKLVIYYAYEAFPFWQCEWMMLLERSIGMLGIDPDNVHLIFGDKNYKQNYSEYLENYDIHYYDIVFKNIHYFPHFEFEYQYYAKKQELAKLTPLFKKKYLCMNGGGRQHRLLTLSELKRRNLLNDGLVSYLKKYEIDHNLEYWFRDIEKYEYYKNNPVEPMILDTDAINEYDEYHNRYTAVELFKWTLFSLVTETYPANPSFFLTEKIFKPIAHSHPFMVIGGRGTLSELKNLGYHTYSRLWDESYDDIEDDADRTHRVLDIFESYVKSKDIKEIWSDIYNVLDDVIHNKKIFMNKKFKDSVQVLIDEIIS